MPTHPQDLARLVAEGEWFDLWHTHVDWKGAGNHSRQARREFLRQLFALWELLQDGVRLRAGSCQSWAVINSEDSGQDAIYVHTSNPNKDNFPYLFEGVTWGIEPPEWLSEFVNADLELGRSLHDGTILYWARNRSQ